MRDFIFLILGVSLIFESCSDKNVPQEFISTPLTEVTSTVKKVSLELPSSNTVPFKTSECLLYDTLAFSYVRASDYMISVSNALTGELIGNFCKRGRAWNELTDALPLQHVYIKNGELKADLISYHDSKVFVWNITKSLQSSQDVYDSIVQLEINKGKTFSVISYCRINELIFCYDSKQTRGYELDDVPEFCIYNLETGLQVKSYSVFKVPDLKSRKKRVSYKDYCANRFSVSKDGGKAFVVFDNFPMYCLIDMHTGKIESRLIKDVVPFDFDLDRWYFADIQSDETYVYVLFSGEELYNKEGTDIPKTLYVFDWMGSLKLKCNLPERFTEIKIDNEMIYFVHYKGRVSRCPISSIIRNIENNEMS